MERGTNTSAFYFVPGFLFFQRNRNILSFTIDTISLGTLTLEIEYIKLDNPKDLIINTFL